MHFELGMYHMHGTVNTHQLLLLGGVDSMQTAVFRVRDHTRIVDPVLSIEPLYPCQNREPIELVRFVTLMLIERFEKNCF